MTDVTLVPFGMTPDGRIMAIDEVSRGLDCNCTCPDCNKPLIAAKGQIYRHHFRHTAEAGCTSPGETALHKFAKQIICERLTLAVPIPMVRDGPFTLQFASAHPEAIFAGLRPDVLAECPPRLAIEIYVSHRVEDGKISAYNQHRMAALEIDLSAYRHKVRTTDEWTTIILATAPRAYLSVPEWERARREADRQAELEERRLAAEEAEQRTRRAAELTAQLSEQHARRAAEEAHRQREAEAQAARERYELSQRAIKHAELQRALREKAEREQVEARARKRKELGIDPPSLQELVETHGGYNLIPAEAWAKFDHDMKVWKEKIRHGDFYQPGYRQYL